MKLFSFQRTSITHNKLGEWRYVWLQSSLKIPDIFKKNQAFEDVLTGSNKKITVI
jgi:hypothetical protein